MQNKEIPQHVVIIPDGNRRWAKEHKMEVWAGHRKAGEYESLNSLLNEARKRGVKYVSLWGFSTENWKREKKEVNAILEVIEKGVEQCIHNAKKQRFCFKHIGRKDRLPSRLVKMLETLEKETAEFKECYALLCLDYGGRDEILRAVNKLIKNSNGEIDEEKFADALDTCGLPDPDLIIRTGGEFRLSGFMPFQSDYAELYFTEKYFPDFDAAELRKALDEYARRQRRFGE